MTLHTRVATRDGLRGVITAYRHGLAEITWDDNTITLQHPELGLEQLGQASLWRRFLAWFPTPTYVVRVLRHDAYQVCFRNGEPIWGESVASTLTAAQDKVRALHQMEEAW